MKLLSIVMTLLLLSGLFALPATAQEAEMEAEPAQEETVANDIEMVGDEAEPDETVVLMDARWAELACEAWNETQELTEGLAAPGWAANDKDRGFKVIQIYRTDCESSPWVELQIADQDASALCVYGGPVQTEELISGVDYIMHAQTSRWQEMGAGDYGPMKGMMTGRLKFKGPKWEAMKNMGPFTSFLQLTGAVPSDASVCPEEAPGEKPEDV